MVDHSVARIDIENGGIEAIVRCLGECLRRSANRPDHLKSTLKKAFPDHHSNEDFVLDQEHKRLVFRWRYVLDGVELSAVSGENRRRGIYQPTAWYRYVPPQTLRIPVEDCLTAELVLDAGTDKPQSEAARRRSHAGAAVLLPMQY